MDNETSRTRDSAEDSNLTKLLSYEATLDKVTLQAITPTNLASLGSKSRSTGTSSITRKGSVKLVVTTIVT
jgi:flagellar L-ring protein precursor FlgH